MYYLDASGKRVYTLKVRLCACMHVCASKRQAFLRINEMRPTSNKCLSLRYLALTFHCSYCRKRHPMAKSQKALIQHDSLQMTNFQDKELQ